MEQIFTKRQLNTIAKLNKDLEDWKTFTGDDEAIIYEDAETWYSIANIHTEGAYLCYEIDGEEQREEIYLWDEDEKCWWEHDDFSEWIKWFRAGLRRAKRYNAMDCDTLDRLQNGEIEDEEED